MTLTIKMLLIILGRENSLVCSPSQWGLVCAVRVGEILKEAWFMSHGQISPKEKAHLTRVFIVEDDEGTRKLFQEILMVHVGGFKVYTACNGKDALEILEIFGSFDIILTDVEMPKMNGIELIRRIQRKWSNVRIIMMSSNEHFARDAAELGVLFYWKGAGLEQFIKLLQGV